MAVTHVKVFVQQSVSSASSTATFTVAPTNANDAILIQVAAAASTLPTGVTITATGYTGANAFIQLGSLLTWPAVASAAIFGAIAPNTSSVTFTVTFTGGAGFTDISCIGDEFSGNDTTGSSTTFDANNGATATTGSPTVNLTPTNANDGVWGAVQDTASAAGSGYTLGANDGAGDRTEWKILSGGSGVAQTVNFTGGPGFIVQAATIKPAGGVAASNIPQLGMLGVGF